MIVYYSKEFLITEDICTRLNAWFQEYQNTRLDHLITLSDRIVCIYHDNNMWHKSPTHIIIDNK